MSLAQVKTKYEHIILDKNDVPVIAGTSMKVVELVLSKTAHGWSPEELHFQFPHLSLGQIHSALAYYWDHQQVLDKDIADRLRKADQIERQLQPVPLLSRLKSENLV